MINSDDAIAIYQKKYPNRPIDMMLEDNTCYYILEEIGDEAFTTINKENGSIDVLWIWDWPQDLKRIEI